MARAATGRRAGWWCIAQVLQRPQTEMGAGIAASPHCAERRICRCSQPLTRQAEASCVLSSILAHQLRRRFRKSIPIRGRVRLLQRPFLDQSPFASPARSPRGLNRVRARKTGSSGASDRLVRDDPGSMPEDTFFRTIPSPAGGDRSFRPFLNLLVVADFPVEAGTSVPITMSLCASIRVAQSAKSESCPVDNGDIADRIGTLSRLPFRSRRPTSHSCPNPLP